MTRSLPRSTLAAAALVLALIAAAVHGIRSDPAVAYLSPRGAARWLIPPHETSAVGNAPQELTAYFRREFAVAVPHDVVIEVRALRAARVWIDGRPLANSSNPQDWKTPLSLALGPLSAGPHVLLVAATNGNGPPAIRVFSATPDLATDARWEVGPDASNWTAPLTADARPDSPLSDRFESAGEAVVRLAPACLVVFALIFACSWIGQTKEHPLLDSAPSLLRWGLLGAWAAMIVNNWSKLPVTIGFDAYDHLSYIDFLLTRHRLPYADEGLQMFQPPLYYLLAAPVQRLLQPLFGALTGLRALRLINYACGAVQVELTYRALKLAAPSRKDLQCLGLLLGGFLPMSLYSSQIVGNEPLCGALSAAAILYLWSLPEKPRPSQFAVLGMLLGLAMLAKTTALLLFGLCLVFLFDRSGGVKKGLPAALAASAAAAAACGWYYLRNWIRLGRPFIGGWDPSRGLAWWQLPGYRTFADFLFHGRALHKPIYAAFAGFWDGFYSTFWLDGLLSGGATWAQRPPWNYTAMIAAAWWSLLPTAAIALGIWRTLFGKERRNEIGNFSVLCLVVYLAAMISLYLRAPFYSVAKATYTLGLIPCFAVLAVSGFETLGWGRGSRAALHGTMACWALLCYGAYLVR